MSGSEILLSKTCSGLKIRTACPSCLPLSLSSIWLQSNNGESVWLDHLCFRTVRLPNEKGPATAISTSLCDCRSWCTIGICFQSESVLCVSQKLEDVMTVHLVNRKWKCRKKHEHKNEDGAQRTKLLELALHIPQTFNHLIYSLNHQYSKLLVAQCTELVIKKLWNMTLHGHHNISRVKRVQVMKGRRPICQIGLSMQSVTV